MKKTYMQPALEVVKIKTTQMLAASPVTGFNTDLWDSRCDASTALSRRQSGNKLWDNDPDDKLWYNDTEEEL